MSLFDKQPWHNNQSPNPFNWEPTLFLIGWLILIAIVLPWAFG